jgi:hypothetical protein
LPRNREGLRRGHDAQLRAFVVDYTDFANADALVDAKPVVTPGRPITIESDS